MILFNTKTKQVIFDAVEQKTTKPNLSLWLHGESRRLITFSDELEDKGYVFLSEDAPEVIKARKALKNKEKLIEQERKLVKERKAQEEVERQNKFELQKKEKEHRHSERLKKIVPNRGNMPKWFIDFVKPLNPNSDKQDEIRETYRYSEKQWIDYYCSSFPSSYFAGFKIVNDLLANNAVSEKYKNLTTIKIADIGCGSGGATIGAITAIEQLLPNISKIEISAFDYNEDALSTFNNCLNAYNNENDLIDIKLSSKVIQFVPNHNEDKNKFTFTEFNKEILNSDKFDFILCFKMVNELIFNHNFFKDAYHKMAQIASPHLSESGFFILLDVSMSKEEEENGDHRDDTQYAILLNAGINDFLRENKDYGCIIPIPCAIKLDCEATRCWIQRLIASEGGREFPATYKVLTRKCFAKQILESIQDTDTSEYIVSELKKKKYKRCFYKNGEMTKSEEISEEKVRNYKNGFCLN